MSRYRTRDVDPFSGSYTLGGTTHFRTCGSFKETCTDVVGCPRQDNPLKLSKVTDAYFVAQSGYNESYTFDHYPLIGYSVDSRYLAPKPPPISECFEMTDALAAMNPSRPSINLPVFLVELRELGQLSKGLKETCTNLKRVGQGILNASDGYFSRIVRSVIGGQGIRKASTEYIKYQFGLKPLLSDLVKMTGFSHSLAMKLAEYDYLASDQGQLDGISRRYTLPVFESEGLFQARRLLNTAYGLPVRAASVDHLKVTQWVTTRWRPSADFLAEWGKPYEARRRFAAKTVLGLQASQIQSNIWQALPWSWLADWLATGGSFLQATNNQVALRPTSACAMRTTKQFAEFTEVSFPVNVVANGPSWSRISKERTILEIAEPTVAFRPALDARRWKLLGALSIQNGWLSKIRDVF